MVDADTLTPEWVTEQTRRLLDERRWTRTDTVTAHDLWSNNQHKVPGGPQDQRAACLRLTQAMLTMVGTGETDLFDPKRLYLYFNCPSCSRDDALFVLRRRPPAGNVYRLDEDVECDCGLTLAEGTKLTINQLAAEFHMRSDAPIYEVAPEKHREEGRAANAAGVSGMDCPYIENSEPCRAWTAGFFAAADAARNAARQAELMAHPTTLRIRELLRAAVQDGASDPRVHEALVLVGGT